MILNNCLDQNMVAVGAIFVLGLFMAILDVTYGLDSYESFAKNGASFGFSVACFVIFLKIQKKVHKDVFVEIKLKVAQ
jgi:hypothetical protein